MRIKLKIIIRFYKFGLGTVKKTRCVFFEQPLIDLLINFIEFLITWYQALYKMTSENKLWNTIGIFKL